MKLTFAFLIAVGLSSAAAAPTDIVTETSKSNDTSPAIGTEQQPDMGSPCGPCNNMYRQYIYGCIPTHKKQDCEYQANVYACKTDLQNSARSADSSTAASMGRMASTVDGRTLSLLVHGRYYRECKNAVVGVCGRTWRIELDGEANVVVIR
ncbi:hypothetical protein BCR34DRAFT_611951 [Clohesyomyces aquaticus]|uniref:Uncharacterized protein n=1 Tax=Clohesyomyces aquaticus TaxID=1231657 RepID=A0A1Y1ZZJ5_9PLEO|nr:hypothetical protein BCR34DRAFT_611951 [Clohesyomyces aquaticus]